MWTSAQLKENAKRKLANYYWMGVVVCLILSFLGGGGGGVSKGATSSVNTRQDITYNQNIHDYEDFYQEPSGSLNPLDRAKEFLRQYEVPGYEYTYEFSGILIAIVAVVVIFALAIGFAFAAFITNPISVGARRFFVNAATTGNAKIGDVFFAFKGEHYLNVVKVMFLYSIKLFGWTLLFIIPGIVKSYEYSMIPFLLAEDPKISSKDAFAMTKEMTSNEKFDIFVLGLSFIGWILLIILVSFVPIVFFGVFGLLVSGLISQAGIALLNPYIFATMTELYFALKAKIYYSNRQGGYDEVC